MAFHFQGGISQQSGSDRGQDSGLVSEQTSQVEEKWEGWSEWSSLQSIRPLSRPGYARTHHDLAIPHHRQSLLCSQSHGRCREEAFRCSFQSPPSSNLSCLLPSSPQAPPNHTQSSFFLPTQSGPGCLPPLPCLPPSPSQASLPPTTISAAAVIPAASCRAFSSQT